MATWAVLRKVWRARADGEAPSPRGWIHQFMHERPMEVEERAIPGNWESDLLIGKAKTPAAVGVLLAHFATDAADQA